MYEVVFGVAQGFSIPADVADVAPVEIFEPFLFEKFFDDCRGSIFVCHRVLRCMRLEKVMGEGDRLGDFVQI